MPPIAIPKTVVVQAHHVEPESLHQVLRLTTRALQLASRTHLTHATPPELNPPDDHQGGDSRPVGVGHPRMPARPTSTRAEAHCQPRRAKRGLTVSARVLTGRRLGDRAGLFAVAAGDSPRVSSRRRRLPSNPLRAPLPKGRQPPARPSVTGHTTELGSGSLDTSGSRVGHGSAGKDRLSADRRCTSPPGWTCSFNQHNLGLSTGISGP